MNGVYKCGVKLPPTAPTVYGLKPLYLKCSTCDQGVVDVSEREVSLFPLRAGEDTAPRIEDIGPPLPGEYVLFRGTRILDHNLRHGVFSGRFLKV